MGELATRKFVGIDFGFRSVQWSVYDEEQKEITEERFPLSSEKQGDYIEEGLDLIGKYLQSNQLSWEDYTMVNLCMEEVTQESRQKLADSLPQEYKDRFNPCIITRFRAFVEYVFRQERAMWDRNTLLLEYKDDTLTYILIDQIKRSKQKAYRAVYHTLNLAEYEVEAGSPEQDLNFSKMMKKFLVRNPANIIFLTGEGFEGNWMKKTLTYLCAGRRVFLGQNLYANGAALMGSSTIPMMEEGLLLMDGPQMVTHTVGLIAADAGKPKYVPITSIGKEWYNTQGSVDIILDKSMRVEFFFHNTKENELESAACEIKSLPKRPPKTTRMRVTVDFHSPNDGVIMLKDLGFGQLYPGTGRITIFPFQLIS